MSNGVAYEIGITKMKWKDRLSIAWRILRKQMVTFNVASSRIYHVNRNQQITEIEL